MNLEALPHQLRGHMGADQLVRIGVVGHDVGAGGNGDRIDGVRGNANSAGKLDGTVLVGVLQANIENRGLVAPIQAFLQLFFGDAFDGHGAILAVPQRIVKVASRSYAERRCAGVSRGRKGRGRGALAACCRGTRAGTVTRAAGSSWTAHPFDRFPQ